VHAGDAAGVPPVPPEEADEAEEDAQEDAPPVPPDEPELLLEEPEEVVPLRVEPAELEDEHATAEDPTRAAATSEKDRARFIRRVCGRRPSLCDGFCEHRPLTGK
jgi:hypothetical protein